MGDQPLPPQHSSCPPLLSHPVHRAQDCLARGKPCAMVTTEPQIPREIARPLLIDGNRNHHYSMKASERMILCPQQHLRLDLASHSDETTILVVKANING
ncbi:hypothetical protein Ancab_021594 [Ancistrocladus abbreviatus]